MMCISASTLYKTSNAANFAGNPKNLKRDPFTVLLHEDLQKISIIFIGSNLILWIRGHNGPGRDSMVGHQFLLK